MHSNDSVVNKITSIKSRNRYWDKRYLKGEIYLRSPSKIIKNSYNLLKKYKQKKILVIGGGYGRNAAFLAKRGFVITICNN